MKNIKYFLDAHKVFIAGLLAAIFMALQPIIEQAKVYDWRILGLAGFTAAIGFVGRNARGQWQTISGIVGSTFFSFQEMMKVGSIDWMHLAMIAGSQLIFLWVGPLKPATYETNSVIADAKQKPADITTQTAEGVNRIATTGEEVTIGPSN